MPLKLFKCIYFTQSYSWGFKKIVYPEILKCVVFESPFHQIVSVQSAQVKKTHFPQNPENRNCFACFLGVGGGNDRLKEALLRAETMTMAERRASK